MSETDPTRIAQLFLNSRANLKTLIPIRKFESILKSIDPNIRPETANDLYELLNSQNNRRIKDTNHRFRTELGGITVTENSSVHQRQIGGGGNTEDKEEEEEEDDDEDIRVQLRDTDRDTLETIMSGLDLLNQHVLQQITELQELSDRQLREIEDHVDDLSDLKYGKLDFMSSISESYESLDRLEKKLLEKINTSTNP